MFPGAPGSQTKKVLSFLLFCSSNLLSSLEATIELNVCCCCTRSELVFESTASLIIAIDCPRWEKIKGRRGFGLYFYVELIVS